MKPTTVINIQKNLLTQTDATKEFKRTKQTLIILTLQNQYYFKTATTL